MSPEQARGKATDSRSDVWAFGCVMYEMLAGEPLFHGETTSDVLAAIVNREPDVSRVPAPVQRLLRACLERDVKRRLQAAGDAWLLLDDDAPPRPAASRLSGRGLLSASVAAVLGIVVTVTVMRWREPIVERGPLQFHANLPEGMRLLEGNIGGTAISPDGRTIAFAAVSSGVRRLWLRRLDSLTPHELSGTTGADYPFWSPDGRSIGFFAEGKLKKVDSSGGQPIVLAEAATGRGGTWLLDGTIIFASASVGGLHRISASGGAPTPVTKLDLANGENAHRWPQFLPGGRRLLYFVRSSTPNRTGVYASSLERPQEAMFVLPTSAAAAYAASHDNGVGHLIWVRDNRLVAQPFDAERLQLSGESAVIAGTEGVGESRNNGRAAFSLSQEGTLLFAGGEDRLQLEWIGRDGRTAGTVGAADRYVALRISPDGVRAAVSLYDASAKRDIWTLDVTRGLPSRVTSDDGFVPVWSPDAERIAYHDTTQTKLLTIAADGSDRQVVLQSQVPTYINDWSPDGHTLLYSTVASSTFDLWLQPLGGERKPKPWLATPYNESHGQFSPDGKWVAFTTDDSGQQEIFVSAFEGKFRRRVSTSGGSFSRWRADGKELFYRALDGRLIAVPVSFSAGQPEFGTPVALIDVVAPLGTFAYPYDLSRDGQKILTFRPVGGARIAPMTVLINWGAGLAK
jgi:Tol biopolymer transport system component